MSRWEELLEARGVLVADGAMGTRLFATGLTAGDPPEIWNVDHPDRIRNTHRSYVEAGSDIILSNSFGGNRHRLKLHGLQDRVHELNVAATANARGIADEADRPVLVAGSMGPTGELLQPLGDLGADDAADAFAEQAAGLDAGGADILWLETMSALSEVEAGVRGARRASDLPIVVTLSYDTAGCTMMGVTGTDQGERIAALGLDAAGAVAIGKTNCDEFAMGSSTENSAFGPTRNPLDTSRVPGGSSGGSAAAVAADFAPVSYIGPLAASVADAALLLEAIGGHDPRDSTSIPEPSPDLTGVLGDGVDGLRIGIIDELMGEGVEGIAADVKARVEEAAAALSAAGATVEHVSVPSTVYGLSAYYLVAPAEASSNLARFDGVRFGLRVDADTAAAMNTATRTAGFGDEVKRRIMLGTYALSAGYYDAYYGKSQKVRTLIQEDFGRAYETYDLLLAPTAPTTAFPLGDKTGDPMLMYLNDVCTIPSNLAGHPSMSVPFGTGDDGLPIGVQVLAPALDEATMFRAAGVLEEAAP